MCAANVRGQPGTTGGRFRAERTLQILFWHVLAVAYQDGGIRRLGDLICVNIGSQFHCRAHFSQGVLVDYLGWIGFVIGLQSAIFYKARAPFRLAE